MQQLTLQRILLSNKLTPNALLLVLPLIEGGKVPIISAGLLLLKECEITNRQALSSFGKQVDDAC